MRVRDGKGGSGLDLGSEGEWVEMGRERRDGNGDREMK